MVNDRLFFAKQRLEDLNKLERSYDGELGRPNREIDNS